MSAPVIESDILFVDGGPAVPGLVFRRFRGESDYPPMVAVIEASVEADRIERVETVESIARNYAHLTNSDPYRDMIFAEVGGDVVGYARGWWWEEPGGTRLYGSVGFLKPDWRRKGIGRTMLRWVEDRLRDVAGDHPTDIPRFFQTFTDLSATGFVALFEEAGYTPVRFMHDMVRPSLDDIPDFPLPEGVEVRPVRPEHYRAIWDADIDAFRGNWGFVEPDEQDYLRWQEDRTIFQPDLWQVAWDAATGEVAGQVKAYINHKENEKYQRQRGYTEFISVTRPWRRHGLARALIARSLRLQKERGMTDSALGVDSENESGASRVYEDCGFRVVKRSAIFRKRLQ